MDIDAITKQLKSIQIPYSKERKDALFARLLEEQNNPQKLPRKRLVFSPALRFAFGILIISFLLGGYAYISTRETQNTPQSTNQALLDRIKTDTKQVESAVQDQRIVGDAEGVSVYQLEDGRIAMAPQDLKNFIETHTPYETSTEISKYKMNETINLFYHTNTRVVELVAGQQDALYIDISKLY